MTKMAYSTKGIIEESLGGGNFGYHILRIHSWVKDILDRYNKGRYVYLL